MCTYCNMGDFTFRHDPPWYPPPSPLIPMPAPYVPLPVNPWPLEKLRDYHDLLVKVRELEERLGCPCEPNKADYIQVLGDRIAQLEESVKKLKGQSPPLSGPSPQEPTHD